jgi:hypothetical protein
MNPSFVIIRLYKGKTMISRLIKWQTRGEYSHAALIVDGVLYEAKEFKGVLKRKAYDDEDKITYDDFLVSIEKEKKAPLVEFLEKQLSKKYDYISVLRFITRSQETRKSAGKWFCSEIIFAALKKVGIVLFNLTEPFEVNPDDLKRSVVTNKVIA